MKLVLMEIKGRGNRRCVNSTRWLAGASAVVGAEAVSRGRPASVVTSLFGCDYCDKSVVEINDDKHVWSSGKCYQ